LSGQSVLSLCQAGEGVSRIFRETRSPARGRGFFVARGFHVEHKIAEAFGWMAGVGALVGLGQLLASEERLTLRIVIGRALSSAGLGAAAASILAWVPDTPLAAQLGLAAGLASLGTSGLERLAQRVFGVGGGRR